MPKILSLFCFFSAENITAKHIVSNDLNEEQEILTKMMQVIEQRDKLVDSLEEQRIREKAEDQHFESFIFSRGCQLSRTSAGPTGSKLTTRSGQAPHSLIPPLTGC